MERGNLMGLLKVMVVRGSNLPSRDFRGGDPYVILTMGDQKLKSSVMKKCLNPEWNEEFTFAVTSPIFPIKLEIFDKDMFNKDDEMGNALIDVQPIIDVSGMDLHDMPYGVPIRKIHPTEGNCLTRWSPIMLEGRNKIVQHMTLRLQDVECGEIEVQMRWVGVSRDGAY